MKLLIACDAAADKNVAVKSLHRAGLPERADALLLTDQDSNGPAAAGERIRSSFPQWRLSFEALSGSPTDSILRTIGWWRPDLVIIGADEFAQTNSSGMGKVWLEVVHRARCSVRVNRPGAKDMQPSPCLVIGNDGSHHADAITTAVAARSWREGTKAHVVTVIEKENVEQREHLHSVNQNAVRSLQNAGLMATGMVTEGDPRQELLLEAERWGADTIFVGARGTHGMGRFLVGSVATAVVTRSRCVAELVR